MAIANAVAIRTRVREAGQRRLAARLQCAPGTVARALRGIDRLAAVMAALDLAVVPRQ